MKLSWSPPPKEKQNGIIVGYKIEIEGPDYNHDINVMDENVNIEKLRSNTNYIFKVSAKTEAGSGPAATFECKTLSEGKILQ